MKLDGLGNIDVETVIGIIEQIDLDHSGDIQETELVAWMEQTQSRSEKALAALKILLGLGQVMSKLPEVLKNDILKHHFTHLAALNFFSFNFAWVFPVCEVDYISSFVLNTIALPGCLLAIVAATWHGSQNNEHHSVEDCNEQISRRSDYYFAFFLSYPTMTQTFVSHLRCRDLGTMLRLEKDYSVDCSSTQWQVLAIVSGLGIAFISVGVPLVIFLTMRKKWNELMTEVRLNDMPRVEAFRDFRRQYGYLLLSIPLLTTAQFCIIRIPYCGGAAQGCHWLEQVYVERFSTRVLLCRVCGSNSEAHSFWGSEHH